MIVNLPYGEDGLTVDVPDTSFGGLIELDDIATVSNPCRAVDVALQTADIDRFLGGANRLLLVVNDAFRMTPTRVALAQLGQLIAKVPEVKLTVATGLHARPTGEEMKNILGTEFAIDGSQIGYSDASDRSQFEVIGKWKDGSEVLMHRSVLWADRVIAVGSVEPHYFAGFTGGAKSFVPGLCFQSSIEANHQLAADMNAQPCKIHGNPVAESIKEAVGFLDLEKILSIQFVTDSNGEIVDVFAGDLLGSHDRAIECARCIYMRPVRKRFPAAIVAHSRPLDRNLYQLQKAFENTACILEDGGELVVVSACRDGVGNDEFYRLADAYPTPESILSVPVTKYNTGFHKLYRTALHLKRIHISVKCCLPDDTVRKVYLEPVGDLQARVNKLLATNGNSSEIVFVKDAGYLVPYVDRAA